MYSLVLIFGAIGGDPSLTPALDTNGNPIRFSTLSACQGAAAKWRAPASNKVDPETGIKAITSYSCIKVARTQ